MGNAIDGEASTHLATVYEPAEVDEDHSGEKKAASPDHRARASRHGKAGQPRSVTCGGTSLPAYEWAREQQTKSSNFGGQAPTYIDANRWRSLGSADTEQFVHADGTTSEASGSYVPSEAGRRFVEMFRQQHQQQSSRAESRASSGTFSRRSLHELSTIGRSCGASSSANTLSECMQAAEQNLREGKLAAGETANKRVLTSSAAAFKEACEPVELNGYDSQAVPPKRSIWHGQRVQQSLGPTLLAELTLQHSGHGCSSDHMSSGCGSSARGQSGTQAQPSSPSSAFEIAKRGIRRARRCMDEYRVLDAEAALIQALSQLEARDDAGTAVQALVRDPLFQQVAARTACYEAAGRMLEQMGRGELESHGFTLVTKDAGARFWVQADPDATWFKLRMQIHFDAPLHSCIVATNECDLEPRWMTLHVQEPEFFSRKHQLHKVVRCLYSALMCQVDCVFEVVRIMDKNFGMMVESIQSDFPAEEFGVPLKTWVMPRISVDATNVWIPVGGGAEGTILCIDALIDPGFHLPDVAVDFIFKQAAHSIISNFRTTLALMKQPCKEGSDENPWQRRLQIDETGLYASMLQLEEAASRRSVVSVRRLPGAETFSRPCTSLGHSVVTYACGRRAGRKPRRGNTQELPSEAGSKSQPRASRPKSRGGKKVNRTYQSSESTHLPPDEDDYNSSNLFA
eukprot:gnl/TRDRNA2_/TRDRNA2_167902_c0_seq4.p1 gnl/TRDRNA2_/TRDRNA2_167902_c0~~gnl/TRDRNA2_/TRDRNA2_167902_c0_seq4.p1  ORF type:complete len:696 (-),score=103.41 gnl/TRDRNA2_/TRDRNA2_167902_c0_seq4:67-2118(-)